MRIDLYGQQGRNRSVPANSQRTINFVPLIDPASKAVKMLVGAPGLELVLTLPTSGCRGLEQINGVGYAVYGNTFYSITTGLVATARGTLGTSTGPVTIAGNGPQVAVCDGATIYVYTIATGAFAAVTDIDFPGATAIDYLDSFGIFTEPNTQKLWITGQLDFTTVDGFDFASAESNPDDLIRAFVDGSTLYLFGASTTEPWYNSGDADFPFTRISGATVERGLLAKFSVAKEDNATIFLADDRVVYRLSGSQITRISTAQVETAITAMSDPSDARGWTYTLQDSRFYVLTFPSAGQTWVYDFSTQLWHERESFGLGRWRGEWGMRLGNRDLVGDYATGKLYQVKADVYDEDGETIISSHIFPSINSEQKIPHRELELEMESGVGLVSGQGSDPIALVSWSDDGGRTWSNELDTFIGRIGDYKRRQILRRLGSSLDRRYKVAISDPVKRVLYGAYLNGRGQ